MLNKQIIQKNNLSMIVCINDINGIGLNNSLLYHIPEDLRLFKSLTENNVVIMGRKTLESLPNGLPLKNRDNIVLTTNKESEKKENVIYTKYSDYNKEFWDLINSYDKKKFIIGGENVYRLLLPFTSDLYITRVYDDKKADTFFPEINYDEFWDLINKSEIKEYEGLKYQFLHYRRK